MINARPGYWDVTTCSWVGAEPMYVVPPVLRSESPAADDAPAASEPPAVPAPRHRRAGDSEVTASPSGT